MFATAGLESPGGPEITRRSKGTVRSGVGQSGGCTAAGDGTAPAQFDGPAFTERVLSINRPLILFTLYALGVLGIAYAAFRSRDVA